MTIGAANAFFWMIWEPVWVAAPIVEPVKRADVPGQIPECVAGWLERLVYGPKAEYARAWAEHHGPASRRTSGAGPPRRRRAPCFRLHQGIPRRTLYIGCHQRDSFPRRFVRIVRRLIDPRPIEEGRRHG